MTPVQSAQTKHVNFSHTLHFWEGNLASYVIGSATCRVGVVNSEKKMPWNPNDPSFCCEGPCFGGFFSPNIEDIYRFKRWM